MTLEEIERKEKEEKEREACKNSFDNYSFPALAYSNRSSERETKERDLLMSAIYTANKHNAMACFGD